MFIIVHCEEEVANSSHRQREERIEVDITDNIETVKIKVTLVYTELDPSKFRLELQGIKCQPNEIIL